MNPSKLNRPNATPRKTHMTWTTFQFDPNRKSPSVSIIIPAHNEEAVIARCLETMLTGSEPGELEIIVACNGCTDRTAQIAEAFPDVRVVVADRASKIAALNLGDQSATTFPRFYVDADVLLPVTSIRRVAAVLRQGRVFAAAPRMAVNLSQCPWTVRAFYDVWVNHPYFAVGMIGSGVYALSKQGRDCFDQFPEVTADDGFLRRLFSEQERQTVSTCLFTISAPRTLNDLIKIKTRSRRGNAELSQKFPNLKDQGSGGASIAFFLRILARPSLWMSFPVYLLVQLLTMFHAHKTLGQAGPGLWERDNSSRVAAQ